MHSPMLNEALLSDLFPPGVVTAEFYGDWRRLASYPEERELVAHAIGKRQFEFAAGRACAHSALSALGLPSAPILKDSAGAPQWPCGISGSISHTEGVTGAAVARTNTVVAIGLDIESIGKVEPALWPLILTAQERKYIERAPRREQPLLSTLFFAAKEALYKCQFAITCRWLDFQDVEIVCGCEEFQVVINSRIPDCAGLQFMPGRFRMRSGVLAAAVSTISGA
jgi:4'-phosphopantetheinyl transferase EntD